MLSYQISLDYYYLCSQCSMFNNGWFDPATVAPSGSLSRVTRHTQNISQLNLSLLFQQLTVHAFIQQILCKCLHKILNFNLISLKKIYLKLFLYNKFEGPQTWLKNHIQQENSQLKGFILKLFDLLKTTEFCVGT